MTIGKNTLKISCWNSRGLGAAIPCIRALMVENDVVAISEHWLHNNRLNRLDEISDKFHYIGRASTASSEETYGLFRGQGGVALFWKKDLVGASRIDTIKHDRICGIRIQNADGTAIAIFSVYMPARGSRDNLHVSLDELEGIIESIGEGVFPIVSGDFNGNVGSEGGVRGLGPPTRAGKVVLEFMGRQRLVAVNLMGTTTGSVNTFEGHNGKSTLDYVMVPECMRENVLRCHVGAHEDVNTSDHVPITVDIDIMMLPRLLIPVRDKGRIRWDKWDGVQRTQLYQIPLGQQLEGVLNTIAHSDGTEGDIERIFDKLIKSLHGAAKAVPRSQFKRNLKPYWSEELRWLKKDKMFWFRRWKEEGRTLDADDPVRQRMKASKKLFAKRLRVISKQYEEDEIAKAASLAEIDRDSFWRVFKRMKGTGGKGVHAIKNPQGRAVYEIGEILEVWRVHFDALSTPKREDRFDNAHFDRVTQAVKAWAREGETSEFMIQPLTSGEVERAIQKLNQGKAPGYDGVTAEHIKFGGHPVAQVLCSLFNLCIAGEYVPNNFRKGIQVPLYKGKNTCSLNPDNYRGITLLSTFNKLFEVVIWGRISAWWFDERIVSDLQGAGGKGSSCIHTALTLQETIAKDREGH